MRYATAADGIETIEAAEIQVDGSLVHEPYQVVTAEQKKTRKNISEHIGIPEDDIVAMFTKPGGDLELLRHFVAIDKSKKEVVLAIRGTFSFSESLIDFNAKPGTSSLQI